MGFFLIVIKTKENEGFKGARPSIGSEECNHLAKSTGIPITRAELRPRDGAPWATNATQAPALCHRSAPCHK